MLVGFAITGLIPNIIPLLTERGMTPAVAISFMGVLGISIITGRLLAGAFLDRMWAPLVACVFLPLPAIASLLLAYGTSGSPSPCSVLRPGRNSISSLISAPVISGWRIMAVSTRCS